MRDPYYRMCYLRMKEEILSESRQFEKMSKSDVSFDAAMRYAYASSVLSDLYYDMSTLEETGHF